MARLSIELPSALHRVIKGEASLRGMSLRNFVISAVHDQVAKNHKASATHKSECPVCALYYPQPPKRQAKSA